MARMMRSCRFLVSMAVIALIPQAAIEGQSRDERKTLPVGNFIDGSLLPTGQFITPTAAPGSTIQVLSTGLRADGNAVAAEAVNTVLSPDGKRCSFLRGWNKGNRPPDGTAITFPTIDPTTVAQVGSTGNAEWVFVFHVSENGK
jgi:hypothetical protein